MPDQDRAPAISSSGASSGDRPLRLVSVAVPAPLPGPLTYGIPEGLVVRCGARVKVPLGRRSVIGVVTDLDPEPPEQGSLRNVLDLVDREPVLTDGLLELARFVSDYYLAPIGEVVRTMLPAELKPWGRGRLRLTERGGLARPTVPLGSEIVEHLLLAGPVYEEELVASLGASAADVHRAVAALEARGVIESPSAGRKGARYRSGVELIPRSLEKQLELCGRSPKARAVVSFLHEALGVPRWSRR